MRPTMLELFTIPIPSYGLMLALSFLLGIWLASWRAKKMGLEPENVADFGFYTIVSAIVGARLYYVILNFDEFRGDLFAIVNPFHGGTIGIGGLVMFGGFIAVLITSVLFFRVKKLSFLNYADALAPSFGLGVFLTRIGCFLNGCCYGVASKADDLFSVSFPQTNPLAGAYQHRIHAHGLVPSQLYESAGGLLMALVLLWVGSKKPFTGLQFYLAVIFYSVLRFSVEFTRHYSASERIGALTHNQYLSIFFVLLFSGLILRKYLIRETEKEAAEKPVSAQAHEKVTAAADKK